MSVNYQQCPFNLGITADVYLASFE